MTALLAACSITPRSTDQPSGEQQKAIQAKMNKLTREVTLKLVALGELDALLKGKPIRVPQEQKRAGLQSAQGGGGSGDTQTGGGTPLPENCEGLLTLEALQGCCPSCSELTLKGGLGYPNVAGGLIGFTGGIAVTTGAIVDDPNLVVEELKNQQP
jgi:hypothetical protein